MSVSSISTENAILGLVIDNPKSFKKISDILSLDNFYDNKNKLVFLAITNSFNKHKIVDSAILINELQNLSNVSKEDWVSHLELLNVEKGIESNIDTYIKILKEKSQTRNLESSLSESISFVQKNGLLPIGDLIGQVESKISEISKQRDLKNFDPVDEITKAYKVKLKEIQRGDFEEGIKTNIVGLDNKLGGLKKGEFVILAARPSMGKTAFALEIAKNISQEKKVGFFSLEMPAEQIIKRMISSDAMIDHKKFDIKDSLNQMENSRINSSFESIENLKLWIDDSASLKISELMWKTRRLNEQGDLDLVVIDYLQLIDSDDTRRESRQQEISTISRYLKNLARELNIPIIAISQLSRRVEQREDKRPQMSDIRESGAIEQDADIIMFLYREGYYKQDKSASQSNKGAEDLEVIISKHRNGPTGIVKLGFDLRFGKISTIHGMK